MKIGKFGVGSDLQYQDVVEGLLILIADRVVELIYDRLGVSYKTVQRTVADLKRVGAIERIGGRRKGYAR